MNLNPYNKLEQKLVSRLNQKRLPNFKQIKYLNKFLNKTESLLLSIGTILMTVGLILFVVFLYQNHIDNKPTYGGRYTEGVIGQPRFINPLYSSLSQTDADISRLIYSGLFSRDNNGFLFKDLVDNYTFDATKKTYTFNLKNNVKWHNNTNLTADDIIFTIDRIQDVRYKSSLRSNLLGVIALKTSDYSFTLTLPENYSPFVELLTFGILPKSLWEEINPENISLAEYNIKPIGSGPYKFDTLIKDKTGLLHNYNLISNPDYYLTKPFIDKFVFKFFASPEELISGLNNGLIDGGNNLNNDNLKNITSQSSYSFQKLKTPSNTALFFNLRSQDSIVYNYNIRKALALAINKPEIIKNILRDNAIVLNSPLNPVSFGFSTDTINYEYNLTEAKKLLETEKFILSATTTNGQIKNTLTKNGKTVNLKLTVINDLEQIKIAEAISATWQDLGFIIDLDIIEKNDFINKTLKPKDFQIVLFSWSAGVNPDPYQMWHSSQSTEKGFNLSGFSDKKIDKLLEDSRINNNLKIRQQNLNDFQKELTTKLPAIFLYSPYQIYIQNKRLKGFNETIITSAEDRFNNITTWYLKESKALK
ncbi:hypothetical protein GW935_03975 [Candidatus Falkowbacteria bacterium]|nr:hypothetical protein [Candidatus Falkowbacteria bacterium]